jgi:long-chain fatty acid transport protein
MSKRINIGIAVVIAAVPISKVSAEAFRLPDQDAFATARGEAFVATADNASAVYYNPAGISQLEGQNLRVGAYAIYYDPTYTPPAPANTNSVHNQNHFGVVPQIFYTYTPEENPVSYGVGIYAPYGLSLHWGQNTGFRTVGTESAINYIRINPIIALKIAPNFSVGAGFTANYAKIHLQQGLTPIQSGNDQFTFDGSGWGFGYTLGALWQPHEKISFGACFRSSTSFTLDGNTTVSFPPFVPTTKPSARTDLTFPLTAVVGVSYRPTPKWNLEFDADYTDWSSMGTATIHQSNPPFPFAADNDVIFNWKPAWMFAFGGTRYLDNGWHVSAGYVLVENAIPDNHYSPVVADVNRHFFSLGTGFKHERYNFDITYQFGYNPGHVVSGSAPSIVGQTADGKYDWISHAVLLTAGVHF